MDWTERNNGNHTLCHYFNTPGREREIYTTLGMNEQSWILLKIDKDWEIRHQFHTTEWIFITSLGRYLSIILKSANAIFRLY